MSPPGGHAPRPEEPTHRKGHWRGERRGEIREIHHIPSLMCLSESFKSLGFSVVKFELKY